MTDTLPYEVPLIFSNDGLKHNLYEMELFPDFIKKIFAVKVTIPFQFKIAKSSFGHRTLGIIHPAIQKRIALFYKDYSHVLLTLCSKSPCSLRYPERIGRYYYEKGCEAGLEADRRAVEIDERHNVLQQEHATSFFSYQKYNLLYKFYDSYEYHRLEKRYTLMRKLDVTRCFENIYTHSISWAVKSKEYAKATTKSYNFESQFDEIMRNANHGETAGILVGSEVSRIFAEIILQQIDVAVIKELEKKGLREGVEYKIKRYVDDYFIFCNSHNDDQLIINVVRTCLEEYKLFLNDDKSVLYERPFASEISIAKNDLTYFLKQFDEELISKGFCAFPRNYVGYSNRKIYQFKTLIKKRHASYSSVSGMVFNWLKRFLKKGLEQYHREFRESAKSCELEEKIYQFLFVLLDFAYFVYSMHPVANSTNKLTEIISIVQQTKEDLSLLGIADIDYLFDKVFKKIQDESIFILQQSMEKHAELHVERLNLLIALKMFETSYMLEEEQLCKISKIDLSGELELNYFQIITLLYYIENGSGYRKLRRGIERCILGKFDASRSPEEDAELVCLFFDIISCPYLSEKFRKGVCDNWAKKNNNQRAVPKVEFQKIAEKQWFTCWNVSAKSVDFERILRKKQINPPY